MKNFRCVDCEASFENDMQRPDRKCPKCRGELISEVAWITLTEKTVTFGEIQALIDAVEEMLTCDLPERIDKEAFSNLAAKIRMKMPFLR